MPRIPSTIANVASRAERAEGRRRLQICVAAGFAGQLPFSEDIVLHVGDHSCLARLERRRDSGAVVVSDRDNRGPGDVDLAQILARLGLGVGDHPELEVKGDEGIRLVAAGPYLEGR